MNTKGNITKNLAYPVWARMKQRCYNPKALNFKYYGGRGVKVCDRWLNSFPNFLSDIGERPSKEYTLDRIDGSGDYEPGNVRWATRSEQMRNTALRLDNPSGTKGVRWFSQGSRTKRWHAQINVRGKRIDLGYHATKEAAINARKLGEARYWA